MITPTCVNQIYLFKVRPIVESIVKKCQQLGPEEYNSVDEQINLTKLLKQCLPKKPNKWGCKIFTRCGVTGMLYNSEIYCGRNANGSLPSHLGVTGD